MKKQILFSSKNKIIKKIKVSSATILRGSLRVKVISELETCRLEKKSGV